MFQGNENVEMNMFLCSLACTWMAIIDSQFYIIDSLSLGGCLVASVCYLLVLKSPNSTKTSQNVTGNS